MGFRGTPTFSLSTVRIPWRDRRIFTWSTTCFKHQAILLLYMKLISYNLMGKKGDTVFDNYFAVFPRRCFIESELEAMGAARFPSKAGLALVAPADTD